MGLLHTIGKRVALQVAAIVARNELFERYGDRPVQPPLDPNAWSDAGGEAEPAAEEFTPGECKLMGATAIGRAIAKGPMVVNHWATWCESCTGEKPALKALVQQTNVPLVGISWDAFEGAEFSESLQSVQRVVEEEGFSWDQLVVKGKAPHFFKVLGVDFEQVPQTWLIDASGKIVHRIEGPIDPADVAALLKRVESL